MVIIMIMIAFSINVMMILIGRRLRILIWGYTPDDHDMMIIIKIRRCVNVQILGGADYDQHFGNDDADQMMPACSNTGRC